MGRSQIKLKLGDRYAPIESLPEEAISVRTGPGVEHYGEHHRMLLKKVLEKHGEKKKNKNHRRYQKK
jgi:hypothetical protein